MGRSSRCLPRKRSPERQRIVAALIELVVEVGYESLTVSAILEHAGVSEADFARKFRDKEDCLDRVWEAMTAEHIALVRETAAAEGCWRDGLRAAAYAALRFHQEDQLRARFFLIEALSTGEFAQARRDVMMEAFVDLIDEGRTELADPESVSRSKAEGVMGAIYEGAVAGMREGGVDALPELVPQLMYIAVLSYSGVEAAEAELRRGPEDIARYERGGS